MSTASVFAGADLEATDRARGYFTGYAPSSPSIGLLRDGQVVWMLERRQIENQGPDGSHVVAATARVYLDRLSIRKRDDREQRGDHQRDRQRQRHGGKAANHQNAEDFFGGVGNG